MTKDAQTFLLVEDNPDDEELMIHGLDRANLKNPIDVARDRQATIDHFLGTGNPRSPVQP